MPPPSINSLHCLILQSKGGLREIPQGVTHYFINSKRRFLVYFKLHEHMIQTMRILSAKNIKFYRRQSLLPDREEQEQFVYHCNYRFKRQDLRKNLYHTTPYNQPKVFFNKYEPAKSRYEPTARPEEYRLSQGDRKYEQGDRRQNHGEYRQEQVEYRREDHQYRRERGGHRQSEEIVGKRQMQSAEKIEPKRAYKNQQVSAILGDKFLLKHIFLALNCPS